MERPRHAGVDMFSERSNAEGIAERQAVWTEPKSLHG